MSTEQEFFDEKILEYRRQARKEKYSTLETGMYIKDELLQFKEEKLFDDKVSIMLPDNFVDMPSNLAKMKYPSEQRPQVIKTSLDTSVNFGFNFCNVPLEKEQIGIAAKQFKAILKRTNPAYIFYEEKEEIREDMLINWFDFKSYCIDDNLYNLMFIASVEKKLFYGIFNCLYEDVVEWKDAAEQIVLSIRDISKEDRNAGL